MRDCSLYPTGSHPRDIENGPPVPSNPFTPNYICHECLTCHMPEFRAVGLSDKEWKLIAKVQRKATNDVGLARLSNREFLLLLVKVSE